MEKFTAKLCGSSLVLYTRLSRNGYWFAGTNSLYDDVDEEAQAEGVVSEFNGWELGGDDIGEGCPADAETDGHNGDHGDDADFGRVVDGLGCAETSHCHEGGGLDGRAEEEERSPADFVCE